MTIPFSPDPTAKCSCGGVIKGGTHSEVHCEKPTVTPSDLEFTEFIDSPLDS